MSLEKQIQDIDSKISDLQIEKEKLVKELFKLPVSKGKQFQNVILYGGHKTYVIEYKSYDGILNHYLSNNERYTTIELEYLEEYLTQLSYYAPTYEEQLKVFEMFGIDEKLTEDEYNESVSNRYAFERSFEDFEDLWNDIVKAGVSSFEFDW